MANQNPTGFPIPFGIQSPNKMFRADVYAGPYDSLQDAMDTVEDAIRIVGRSVGIYSLDRRSITIYHFELDQNDDWILVPSESIIERTSDIPINDGEFGTDPYLMFGDIYQGNVLLHYGVVWLGGYDYYVWADLYRINGITYTNFIFANITLDPSDNTFGRRDVIVVNSNETITKITGTPSANPFSPTIDYNTQLLVTEIDVKANSTEPDDITDVKIYDENLQIVGGEADTSTASSNITLDSEDVSYTGTKSIKFDDADNLDKVLFNFDMPILKDDFNYLVLFVKLQNPALHKIAINFVAAGVSLGVSADVIISNNKYGFSQSNTSVWQYIIIPMSDFNLQAVQYGGLRIENRFQGASFYVDNIFLQKNDMTITPVIIEKTSDIPINDGATGASPYATMADVTGLEAIDQGNGIGRRLIGANPDNYGNIGLGAIDLGASDSPSTTVGATGDYSTVGGGYNNTASEYSATVGGGSGNEASGYGSTVGGGANNISSGGNSVVGGGTYNEASGFGSGVGSGAFNIAKSFGEFLTGLYATIKEGNANSWITTDRIFGIGNGKGNTQRSDAFNVYKNGVAELPSVTNELIDAAYGKTIPTKEWVEEQVVTLEGYHETGTRVEGDLEVVIGDWDNSSSGEKLSLDIHGLIKLSKGSNLARIEIFNDGGEFYEMSFFNEYNQRGTYISHNMVSTKIFRINRQTTGGINFSVDETPAGGSVKEVIFQYKSGTVALLDDLVKLPKTISDATYILLEEDKNKILHFTNATGVTVTVPTSLTLNNRYEGKQMGAGQVTFVADTGVTINKSATDTNKTADQYSVFGLDCTDTEEYVLFGKLELV